jgi:predicted amidohydrolase YtcJ
MKTVYYNGNVITMGENGVQEAFVCEDGSFIDVGTNERVLSMYPDAAKDDLNQQTVMPSFLDAHSHLSSYANTFLQASLDEAESFTDIIRILRKFAEDRKVKKGDWLIANGYDHNCLK